MNHKDIIPCGTKVSTVIGNISALITAACLRFEKVQYEISYFLNGERKEVWVDEREIIADPADKIQIGFRK